MSILWSLTSEGEMNQTCVWEIWCIERADVSEHENPGLQASLSPLPCHPVSCINLPVDDDITITLPPTSFDPLVSSILFLCFMVSPETLPISPFPSRPSHSTSPAGQPTPYTIDTLWPPWKLAVIHHCSTSITILLYFSPWVGEGGNWNK